MRILRRPSPTVSRVLAALLPILVGAALTPLRGVLTQAALAVVFVLVIVVVAAAADRVAMVIVALSAAAWFEFFFSPPFYSFQIASADDIELMILMIIVSLLVGEIALWGFRNRDAAAANAGYLEGILDVSPGAATDREAGDPSAIAHRIQRVLGTDEPCLFIAEPPAPDDAVVQRDGTITIAGRATDTGKRGLPSDRYVAIPVLRVGGSAGHFRVSAASEAVYPGTLQLKAAVLLAEQLSA
jgi:hypothetical protein